MLLAVTWIATSTTVAFIAAFAWFSLRHPNASSLAQFTDPSTVAVGAFGFLLSSALLFGLATTGGSAPWSRDKSTRATTTSPHVIELVDQLALAAGVARTHVVVFDDPAPNTTITVKKGTVGVVLTSGACQLPRDELAALIAFNFAMATSVGLRRAQAARVSVGFFVATTKVLWVLLTASFVLCGITRQAMPFAVGMLIGAVGLIVLIPLGALISASAVTLAIAANTIADRDAVSMTFLPDVYLRMLLNMIDDDQRTDTTRSPLIWFERTTTRDDLPAMIGSAISHQELVHRAEQMAAIAALPLPDPWPPTTETASPTT